jgi:hypothetical protein
MRALCLFAVEPTGFRHREFRDHVAQLQAQDPHAYPSGSVTYDLRRLRLHALIERVPRTHRYQITSLGSGLAMLNARLYTRALRPAALSSLPARFAVAVPSIDSIWRLPTSYRRSTLPPEKT